MRDAVDILDVAALGRSDGCFRLKEPAPCGDDFIAGSGNLDVVFLHFRMRFGAEDVCMHIRKVTHVEKILDGARGRDADADGPRIDVAALAFGIFRDREKVRRRLAKTRPHAAISGERRQLAGHNGRIERLARFVGMLRLRLSIAETGQSLSFLYPFDWSQTEPVKDSGRRRTPLPQSKQRSAASLPCLGRRIPHRDGGAVACCTAQIRQPPPPGLGPRWVIRVVSTGSKTSRHVRYAPNSDRS